MGEIKSISVISVVLFIGAGALVFFLLFILAKRQIIRFAWKATRPPHASIGLDAPKDLKEKILSRLDRIAYIRHEPLLLNPKVLQTAKTGNKYSQTCIKRSPWGQRKSGLIRQFLTIITIG